MIAIGAWQDCREYNRVQTPFDSAGFRWFYRIARTSAIVAFLLHAISTLIVSRAYPDNQMIGNLKYFFDFSPDFLILFSAVSGAMPLSAAYFRERGNLWQRVINGLGGLVSVALILHVMFDPFWIIALVMVSVLGIVGSIRQPVLPYDDPMQFFGTIKNLISDSTVVVDMTLAVLGAIGVAILILCPRGSLRAKLGLLVAIAFAFHSMFGLLRYWNEYALFHGDLRNSDAMIILSNIPLFGFGIGLLAGYLSFTKSKSPENLPGFVSIEYRPDSFFASVGIGGAVVTEIILESFRELPTGFPRFLVPGSTPLVWLLFWVLVGAMGLRLLSRKGPFSFFWWLTGHAIIVVTIACGVYGPQRLSDSFLDLGSGIGWSSDAMQVWVYFIRSSLIVVFGFCILKRYRKQSRSANPSVVRTKWVVFAYLLLIGAAFFDQSLLGGSVGWIVGLEWIVPLARPVNPILVFLSNSLLYVTEMGALIVLWVYGLQESTYLPGSIPSPQQAQCWRFSFRRFACLLVLLTVYVPAIIIFGLRLFVHLYAMANNLTAGA
jgi:hypothetical protein